MKLFVSLMGESFFFQDVLLLWWEFQLVWQAKVTETRDCKSAILHTYVTFIFLFSAM